MTLNNPYTCYPRTPFAGYHEFKQYNNDIAKLYTLLDIVSQDEPILFQLICGAAMEEKFMQHDPSYNMQWQQLFPLHVQQYLTRGGRVIQVIISPNTTFHPDTFETPNFILNTQDEYEWELVGDRHFTSNKFKCDIYIFCSMMPHCDLGNARLMTRLEKLKESCSDSQFNFDDFKQTSYDRQFIVNFYEKLEQVQQHIISNGGYLICFSYAVFLIGTDNDEIDNFKMFSEIKALFKNTDSHSLLAEWIYRPNNFTIKKFNSDYEHYLTQVHQHTQTQTYSYSHPVFDIEYIIYGDHDSYLDDEFTIHTGKYIIFKHDKIMFVSEYEYNKHMVSPIDETSCLSIFSQIYEQSGFIDEIELKHKYLNELYMLNVRDMQHYILHKPWIKNNMILSNMNFDDIMHIYKIILLSTDLHERNTIIHKYNIDVSSKMFDDQIDILLCSKILNAVITICYDDDSVKNFRHHTVLAKAQNIVISV